MAALRRQAFLFPTHFALQIAMISAAFFAVLAAGALFVPVGSGPDEAAHYVYAAAVVRGQAAVLEPTLPARVANIHSFATCIAFQPDVTAACQGPLRINDELTDVRTQTNAGLYNPAFYAWTGLGSLIVPTEYGLYISRLLSAGVTSVLLGWAVSLLLRTTTTPWARAGVGLVLTPMALYCGMVLNPSAWEIASMMGVVVALHAILRDDLGRRWSEAHSLLLAAGVLLVISRGLSPLLLTLTIAALLLTRRIRDLRSFISHGSVWTVASVFAIVGVLSVGWVLAVGTNYVGVTRPASLSDGITGISVFYANFHDQLTQMYGSFGWLELASPNVLSSAWVFAIGFFLLVSFALSDSRARRGILLAFAAATLLPGVLAGLQWSGMGWQGRYTLPLVAACLLIAGLSCDEAAEGSQADAVLRLAWIGRVLLPALFVVGVCASAIQVAHRYLVGVSQPWLATPSWAPPVDAFFLALLLAAGTAVIFAALVSSPQLHDRSVR